MKARVLVTGVVAGIVLVHTVLQTKTTELVDSLEMASVKFLNSLTERRGEGTTA